MNENSSPDVIISDCVLRDGLQSLRNVVTLEDKQKILALLVDSGIGNIEITSMVPPDAIPQFADAAAMIDFARQCDVRLATVLVPNLKGAQRALEAGAKSLVLPLSVSQSHSMKNIRKSTEAQLDELKKIRALISRQTRAEQPLLAAGISTAFGCSYEGKIQDKDVFALVEQCMAIGVDEIGLADTVGYADPAQVKRIFTHCLQAFGSQLPLRAHFHDTFGLGLVNVYAALEAGVRIFDASLCGLGGCPFAINATGNITLEDLVYLMQKLGLKTGIDLDSLLGGQPLLRSILPNETLYGAINRAGKYPADFTPEKVA